MTRLVSHLLVVALMGVIVTRSQAAGGAGFATLDVPGADSTAAHGINDRGQIVGSYSDAGGTHGFLLSDGTYTTIDFPGATFTSATDINNRGDVVGYVSHDGRSRGFLLSKGTFTSIDSPNPNAVGLAASGISPQGDIVGVVRLPRPDAGFVRDRDGALRQISLCWPVQPECLAIQSFTTILDINARRQIVGRLGYSDVAFGHAFLMVLDRPQTLTLIDLPGVDITIPYGINAAGEIVGSYRPDDLLLTTHGFIRDANGNVASIDVFGATSTVAAGINARGTIVGYYGDAQNQTHGFVVE